MSVVLLRWNPEISSYRMDSFRKAVEEARNTQNYMLNWSVWEHEKVHCGDRFFMLRVGKGKTGVVMSGRIVSEPYRGEDWSGKGRTTYYANIVPDFLVDTERGPRLGIADLEKAFPRYVWNEGHSGMVLSESLGTKLEWLWADFLFANFDSRVKRSFACNLCPTDDESVAKAYHYVANEPLMLDLAKKKGVACEICGYEYENVFDCPPGFGTIQNPHRYFPGRRAGKTVRRNFHCVCANCMNMYKELCSDENDGRLLPFERLAATKRKAPEAREKRERGRRRPGRRAGRP